MDPQLWHRMHGVWKSRDFGLISHPISEMIQDRAIMQIGNRNQAFKWYHFHRPWVTFNSDFKVTMLLMSNNLTTVAIKLTCWEPCVHIYMPKIVTFGLIEWTWDSFPMSNCAKIARRNFYKNWNFDDFGELSHLLYWWNLAWGSRPRFLSSTPNFVKSRSREGMCPLLVKLYQQFQILILML